MKLFLKQLILFFIGGIIYIVIELLFRGYTHWSMFILGGLCFIEIGLINEIVPWETSLILQMIAGALLITTNEFVCGIIVNICLKWDIWDYSNMPLNILGQICLPFSLLWILVSLVAIILDDFIRWKWFEEEKPRYKLF